MGTEHYANLRVHDSRYDENSLETEKNFGKNVPDYCR